MNQHLLSGLLYGAGSFLWLISFFVIPLTIFGNIIWLAGTILAIISIIKTIRDKEHQYKVGTLVLKGILLLGSLAIMIIANINKFY